jgi:hypothetical protein
MRIGFADYLANSEPPTRQHDDPASGQ